MTQELSEASYSFRVATQADYDFLYHLHTVAMRCYIEALWGWEESWQREYFSRKFDPSMRRIICVAGRDAGVLVLEHCEHELYISLIELLPRFQGQGVGTAVINDLLAQAAIQGKTVTLHVLKSNKPARRLYERLGFQVSTEEEYHFKMIHQRTVTLDRSSNALQDNN